MFKVAEEFSQQAFSHSEGLFVRRIQVPEFSVQKEKTV